MDYAKISKDTIQSLYCTYNTLLNSPLDKNLRVLIELFVSQINGCNYCIDLHEKEALRFDVNKKKIHDLPVFFKSELFSESEKEALKFCKSLTKLDGNKKIKNTNLLQYFNEREICDIVICASLMNSFNRITISMKDS